MRLSTLTIAVFVAHTSTLAITAPLPFADDVQELTARGEDDPPASSSGAPIPASARWAQVALRFAKGVPPALLNAPIPNNKVSALQKVVGMAANGGSASTTPRISPRLHLPPSPAVPQMNLAVRGFKQKGPSAFDSPTGPAASLTRQAVAQLKKNQAHPVKAALEQLHRGQQSRPPGSSPARKASTGDKATPARKASTVGKATPARKASTSGKGAAAHRASSPARKSTAPTPKRVSPATTPKVSKAPRKRDLEIDELD